MLYLRVDHMKRLKIDLSYFLMCYCNIRKTIQHNTQWCIPLYIILNTYQPNAANTNQNAKKSAPRHTRTKFSTRIQHLQ